MIIPQAFTADFEHLKGTSKEAYGIRAKAIKEFYNEFLMGRCVSNAYLAKEFTFCASLIKFNAVSKTETKAKASNRLDTTIAVFYLPQLLENARFIKFDNPKPNQIKKTNAIQVLVFYSDMVIDGDVKTFKISVIKQVSGRNKQYCVSANIELNQNR